MAKSDLISFEGRVISVEAGGRYKVKLENKNIEVTAKISGKMTDRRIHVVAGDRVTVGLSPSCLERGLITYRHTTKPPASLKS